MRAAGSAVGIACAVADDDDRQLGIADIGAHLLVAAHGRERCEREGQRAEALVGKTGGDAHQVLLGNADVVAAVRIFFLERLNAGGGIDVGGQNEHIVILAAERGQALADSVACAGHYGHVQGHVHFALQQLALQP